MSAKSPTFSAYLSVFNDWDVLAPALHSMKGRISELVIIDGAHRWMCPYLKAIGVDPERSLSALYEVVESVGIPTRTISKVWDNEVEKRIAGYSACTTDYIYRIDADEVFFFNEDALKTFVQLDEAIAEMEMPVYDQPGYIHANDHDGRIGRQPFLFNASKVTAEQHLHYLWLVLTVDELPEYLGASYSVFDPPIAFNAHLSLWRENSSAAQRSAFYSLNWVRQNGFPQVPSLSCKPLTDLEEIFRFVKPDELKSALCFSKIANGRFELTGNVLRRTPLSSNQEATFAHKYDKLLSSSFALNYLARREKQYFLSGSPICFNVSNRNVCRDVISNGRVRLQAGKPLGSASASLNYVLSEDPYVRQNDLVVRIDDCTLEIDVSHELFDLQDGELRCTLTVSIWLAPGQPGASFLLVS